MKRDFYHTGLQVGRSDVSKAVGQLGPGNIYYVDSRRGALNASGINWDNALNTLDEAVGLCSADNGDIIRVAQNHAETVGAASAITLDVSGITIECMGSGDNRPTFTFSATAATIVFSAAGLTMKNFIVKPSIDSVVSPIVVSAADCAIDVEVQDASAAIECVSAILTTAGADRLAVNLKYRGFIAGNACVAPVRLVGVDTARINVDFYGVASTAVVEYHTTACHDIVVTGKFYNDGTSLTKNVVDTVTGSTWSATGWDGNSNSNFSGGDNAALASDVTVSAEHIAIDASTKMILGEVVNKTAATLPQTAATALFTVAGGRVMVTSIVGEVTTIIQTQANNTKLVANPTTGTSVDMCAVLDISADEVGCLYGITGVPGDALVGLNAGLTRGMASSAIVNVGTIDLNCAASNTGATKWSLHYIPIDVGATVVAA